MKEKCLKVALCLMAVASLGNALGAEPISQTTITQNTDFDSRTQIPYPIGKKDVEYLVEKKWVMNMRAFCTVVTVTQPEYVAPPEPLFDDIGYQFEGYFGLFVTDTGVVERMVFDKDGKPMQFIYPGEVSAFRAPSYLYAVWWQTPFGKEKVLYFLARLIKEARAGGDDGAQRQVEKYSEEIAANPEKWELYVYRSFARLVTLWDDSYVKSFAEYSGLDVVDPVLNFAKQPEATRPDGKIIRPTVPLSLLIKQIENNQNMDKVCGSALPIIESAIADLDEIPDTWSGSVDITAANTGYPFDKHKTYRLDYADAQMIKAMFRGVMCFLELARGYNPYSAGVEPDGVNRAALAEAREYYLKTVEMLRSFNAAHSRRTDYDDHLFMLIPYESRTIKSYEQTFLDLPWWTAELDLEIFAEMCFTKQTRQPWKEWKNPEEEINRKRNLMRGKRLYVSLKSLFNGEVSRTKGTFPQLINNSVMLARNYGLTDPTLAGMFPELTRKGLGEYISIFDTRMYSYEPDTDIKYHAVVYTLPEGAKNNSENPNVYMTEDPPIVLKDPTFEGHKFTGWSNIDGSNDGVIPAGSEGPMRFKAVFVPKPKAEYVTANGEVDLCTNCVVVTEDTTTFEDGQWYIVTNTVLTSNLTVNGSAHLILCDGAKLVATGFGKQDEGDHNHAGIEVSAGNALTIYGQKLGTGELEATATGGHNSAGIGASEGQTGGVVTINGGIITATGSNNGAGIGSGYAQYGSDDFSNRITINGGRIKATGGGPGAGLGGGYWQHGGELVINGGTVEAIAGWNGGFSLGNHAEVQEPRMRVVINGGNVKADKIFTQPTNSANAAVWCVTVELSEEGRAGSEELVKITGLDGYGTRDIEPIDGKVYLYLPNGTYYFKVNDQWYKANVKDAATVAKAHSPAAVKVISAKQRWPWNGKVDVVSSVVRPDATKYYQLVMDLTLGETTKRVSYELGAGKEATYTNTVDCAALFGENVVGEVSVNVSLEQYEEARSAGVATVFADLTKGVYLIIDLEDGSSVETTLGDYLESHPDAWTLASGWADAYKTRYLVMRKVKAGKAYPCEPDAPSYPISGTKTPTKDFYAGVYEVTEEQYARVMGEELEEDAVPMMPKSYISWNTIRGNKEVLEAPEGFMSAMAKKTALTGFDLPTDRQWEIAARAGSREEYGSYVATNGAVVKVTKDNLIDFAIYSGNAIKYDWNATLVGQRRPNLWGLHDTSGNVWEWCRDDDSGTGSGVEIPAYKDYTYRVHRGGMFHDNAVDCRPSITSSSHADQQYGRFPTGFRLFRTLEPAAK